MSNTRYSENLFSSVRFFQSGANTIAEYMDQPAWKRRHGGIFQGDGSDGSAPAGFSDLPETVGGAVGSQSITASRTNIYSLELRDETRALISTITTWFDGNLRLEMDVASSITFAVLASDSLAAQFILPNQIWLRDRWGLVVDQFNIQKTTHTRTGEATHLIIEGQSIFAQLTREYVLEYSTGYDTQYFRDVGLVGPDGETYPPFRFPAVKPIKEILSALFALQEMATPITLGYISPAIGEYEIVFNVQNVSLLAAIKKIKDMLPEYIAGSFYMNRGIFEWSTQIGTVGEVVGLGKRLKDVNYEQDYSVMSTRLYMYGEGEDNRTRVNLTQPGASQANEYIDSDTIGTWGTIPRVIQDKRYKHPAGLLKVAQRILEEIKNPYVTLNVEAIDLAKADTPCFESYNDIYPGSEYNVVDDNLGFDLTVKVKAIETSLNPGEILTPRIEMTNRRKSLGDIIAAMLDQMAPPLDILDDGQKYPHIERLFDGDETDSLDSDFVDGLAYKDGDLKVRAEDSGSHKRGLSYYRKNTWRGLSTVYMEDTAAEITDEDIEPTSIAIIGGELNIRNAANNEWVEVNRWVSYTGV